MKYRIKVVVRKDGSAEYFPQYKNWVFWCYFIENYNFISFKDEKFARNFISLYKGSQIGSIVYMPID